MARAVIMHLFMEYYVSVSSTPFPETRVLLFTVWSDGRQVLTSEIDGQRSNCTCNRISSGPTSVLSNSLGVEKLTALDSCGQRVYDDFNLPRGIGEPMECEHVTDSVAFRHVRVEPVGRSVVPEILQLYHVCGIFTEIGAVSASTTLANWGNFWAF